MWATEFDFAKDNFNGGNLAINESKDTALLFYIDQEKTEFVDILNEKGEFVDSKFKLTVITKTLIILLPSLKERTGLLFPKI